MDESIRAILTSIGGRLIDFGFNRLTAPRRGSTEARIQQLDKVIESIPEGELVIVEQKEKASSPTVVAEEKPEVADACLPCAVGHFSASSGVLKEALRFKSGGITSNEIIDRIACALEEQNALEREDLTPDKIQRLPGWEKEIAEEALSQSRQLRHKLEAIQTIDELEQVAADTRAYYIKLNRQWHKGRFGYLGQEKASVIASRV